MKLKAINRVSGVICAASLLFAIGTVGLADMGELHIGRLVGSVIVFILSEVVWLITREAEE